MSVHTLHNRSTVRGQVAAEVRAEMSRCKISTNRLPSLLGKSQSYWQRRVNAMQPMDVDDLVALATLMEVPVTKFFGAVNGESPHPEGEGCPQCAVRELNPQPADPGTLLSTIGWAA